MCGFVRREPDMNYRVPFGLPDIPHNTFKEQYRAPVQTRNCGQVCNICKYCVDIQSIMYTSNIYIYI